MSRFFNSFFSDNNQRPIRAKFREQVGKKSLNFESLEARRVMHGAGCQVQIPAFVAPSESQLCTAMTLEEFIAQTGTIVDEGIVMKLSAESGDSEIAQLDRPDLLESASEAQSALPVSTPAKGDANSDGFVNEDDLAAWTANFTGDLGGTLESPASAGKLFAEGDFDGDGDVDLNDLGEWAANYTGLVDNEQVTDASLASDAASSTETVSSDPQQLNAIVGPTPGDADFDLDVDNDDLATWELNFTGDLGDQTGVRVIELGNGDFDLDGDVDLNDLGIWAENFTGPTVPVAETAAEPEEVAVAFATLEDASTSLVITPTAGDADADGDIDEDDSAIWTANFTGDLGGNLESPAKSFSQGDFDLDGDVDLNDLGLWAEHYTGAIEIIDV